MSNASHLARGGSPRAAYATHTVRSSYILLAGFKMGDVCVLILYSTLPFSGARFALAGERCLLHNQANMRMFYLFKNAGSAIITA